MKIFDYAAGEFAPTQPQFALNKEFSDEASYLEVVVAEHQRQIKVQSRQIAAGAIPILQQALPETAPVPEPELVQLIELLASSLSAGIDTPVPFGGTETAWFLKVTDLNGDWNAEVTKPSEAKVLLWEHAIKAAIQSASQELALHHYVVFEQRAEEALQRLRRLRAAVHLHLNAREIAGFASDNFIQYCRMETPDIPDLEAQELKHLLGMLNITFVNLLKTQNESEVVLNLCTFWAQHLIPRYDCSLQEWQFLVASIELGVHRAAGDWCSRELARYFLILNQAVTRFAFCGVFFRNFNDVLTRINQPLGKLPFDSREYLRTALGQLLLDEGSSGSVCLQQWGILTTRKPLGGVQPEVFRRFTVQAVNACRHLAERSWLDWLEEELNRAALTLEYAHGRLAMDATLKEMTGTASENLREGLEVFRTYVRLSKDLTLLLDTAHRFRLLSPTISQAKTRYQTWFAQLFAAGYPNSIWQHTKTIARALVTAVRQNAGSSPFWIKYLPTLELIEALPEVIPQAQFVLQAFPQITPESVIENQHGNENCHRDIVWMVRRSLLEYLRHGETLSPQATLNWMLEEVFPYLHSIPQEDFYRIYSEVYQTLIMHEGVQESGFLNAFGQIVEESASVSLSIQLWRHSDSLGKDIAERIYERLPDYKAQTNHDQGLAKCARDNSIALRRVALAFQPGITDRISFFESWWSNLINQYIFNRPSRLFHVNRVEMLKAIEQRLGEQASQLVDTIIQPVYDSALTTEEETKPETLQFVSLPCRYPLYNELATRPEFHWPTSVELNLRQFLTASVEQAFQYATGQTRRLPQLTFEIKAGPKGQASAVLSTVPEDEFLEHNLNFFCTTIVEGFTRFEWAGFLDAQTATNVKTLIEVYPSVALKLERFLVGLIYQTDSFNTLLTRLRAIDYFQAVIDFCRQSSAGHELDTQVAKLAGQIADHLHSAFQADLKNGVSAPSREKCTRDLAFVLNALADGMKRLPAPAARLNVHRYLTEQVSPFIAYGEDVWKMTWQAAWFHAEKIFPPATYRELKTWFRSLEKIGKPMVLIGALNQKFVCSQEPIFSPNPDEETEWRQTVCTLLALAQINAASPKSLPAIRWILAESLPLTKNQDFPEKLTMILNSLRNWFIDLDLSPIQAQFEAFEQVLADLATLRKFSLAVNDVRQKLTERLPAVQELGSRERVNSFLFWMGRNALYGSAEPATRWGVPPEFKFLSESGFLKLGTLTSSEIERLQAALFNSFAVHLPRISELAPTIQRLQQLAQTEKDLRQIWSRQWQVEGKEFSHASCQRDLQWMARRVCIDGWLGNRTAEGAIAWYLNEVIPFAGQITPKNYIKAMKLLFEKFQTSNLVLPDIKTAADNFQTSVSTTLSSPKKVDPTVLKEFQPPEDEPQSLWKKISGAFSRPRLDG